MTYGSWLIPIIGAITGWLLSRAGIWMLFHPRKPTRILGIALQGVLPRKQQVWAEKLGTLVSNEFLSFGEIEEKITHPGNVHKIMPAVEKHIDDFLRIKLPIQMPVISMFIGDKTITELKTVFTAELETLFPVIMKQYMDNLQQDIDVEKLVAARISRFSTVALEKALHKTMGRELTRWGLVVAGWGFLMGLLLVWINSLR